MTACDVVLHAAGQSRLALRRLYGDQASAYTCTLPFVAGCGEAEAPTVRCSHARTDTDRTACQGRGGAARCPAQCRRAPPRQPQPAHARQLRRYGVRHAQSRPVRPRARCPFHVPCHGVAPLHAGAPRHLVRLARLPLATLGFHRDLGGAHHAATPASRRDDHARVGPPAPLRGRGRELSHGLQRVGLRARARGRPWRTYPDPSYIGAPALPARGGGWYWRDRMGWAGSGDRAYDRSRTFFRAEEDFPGPRTMRTAAGWLRNGAPEDAPFLLFVDEFDPHEPFDTPEPWAGRYDPDWDGELLIWPPYDVGAVAAGPLERARGPAHPGQLRRQARHDRPLGRRGLRRARPSAGCGRARR